MTICTILGQGQSKKGAKESQGTLLGETAYFSRSAISKFLRQICEKNNPFRGSISRIRAKNKIVEPFS
jgi:hypothetical protein